MATRSDSSRTLKVLKAGPSSGEVVSSGQVASLARKQPREYRNAVVGLCKSMLQQQFKNPSSNIVAQFCVFSAPWRDAADDDDVSQYYFGTIDAYSTAIDAQLLKLDWRSGDSARSVADKLLERMPDAGTVEGLVWRVLLGQVQSVYSRDNAAATFQTVRAHPAADLVRRFYRDTGAFTYFSESEVAERRRVIPHLSGMITWASEHKPRNRQAVVLSVDPYFFRTYGPMILFNAQQAPEVDFVVNVCGTAEQVARVEQDAQQFLSGLSTLNRQGAPRNLLLQGVGVPDWVVNRKTFYASARFLVLRDLLEDYEQLYALDADMFMLRHPREFLNKTSKVAFGATSSNGPVSVSPWRRIMGGTLVVNRDALTTPMLSRTMDYLSAGLTERHSWMLDQNALAYAVEADPTYQPLQLARPTVIGTFMATWEKNFQSAIK